ncbi:MAG: hypothetical protein MI717_05870 [Spirochaetales bacterium]|nr:hypothetical protein [Spirochaetales bacterium]
MNKVLFLLMLVLVILISCNEVTTPTESGGPTYTITQTATSNNVTISYEQVGANVIITGSVSETSDVIRWYSPQFTPPYFGSFPLTTQGGGTIASPGDTNDNASLPGVISTFVGIQSGIATATLTVPFETLNSLNTLTEVSISVSDVFANLATLTITRD